MQVFRVDSTGHQHLCRESFPRMSSTCSLHCNSFFGLTNYIFDKDFIRYPQKGTTMETIGSSGFGTFRKLGVPYFGVLYNKVLH